VIDKINAAVRQGIASLEVQSTFAKLGLEPKLQPPDELSAILTKEAMQWGALVKSTGIKLD
jgi:tripartite-type tricarboxylate transporter receptor subunit TctC